MKNERKELQMFAEKNIKTESSRWSMYLSADDAVFASSHLSSTAVLFLTAKTPDHRCMMFSVLLWHRQEPS